jgi:uncharacterized membrane protein YfcA
MLYLVMSSSAYLGFTVIGILTGLTAGVIGAGAEILIVPLLAMFGLLGTMKRRIGTSLIMLLPPIGLMAAYRFYQKGLVDVKAGLYMALLFAICAYISSSYAVHLDEDTIRQVFAVFTIGAGLYCLVTKDL